ncbi:hypothetical protein [Flavobacterium soli]|uniref:hypothetical protein n=1 Tax=Flavobacterium soli TaxID=344881 RepID=UPI0004192F85|nr:hypothetical protein [Flavobacterium soli]
MEKNQNEIIDTIKLLIYKENPSLLEKVNFEDDNIFLEPLLFAYFNGKNNNQSAPEMLIEIMQGYFLKKENIHLKASLNNNGIAFLPNLGYFDRNANKMENLLKIDEFEILKSCHPLLESYFVESYKGHIVNPKPLHNTVWIENHQTLEKAILVIKEHLPFFYKELVFSNRRIYLHDNPKILNFASIETLGMLYFYVLGTQNIIYFIEELIHQGSHNFLYYVVHDRKEYFKIDVDNIVMRDLTDQQWDYRTVYGAFHGLFTVTQRIVCFDILLSKKIFRGREKHELLGRMTDMIPRFKTGLELLDLDYVYTEKGKAYYYELYNKCQTILNKYQKLIDEFDLSHRDLDFRYDEFCELNSYQNFLKKDENNHYDFFSSTIGKLME